MTQPPNLAHAPCPAPRRLPKGWVVCAIAAALAGPATAWAQYGSAYRAPNTLRLTEMANAAARNAMNDHYARIAPSRSSAGGSGAALPIRDTRNDWANTEHIEWQRALSRKLEGQRREADAKWAKFQRLSAERRLVKSRLHHAGWVAAAREAGFSEDWIRAELGHSGDMMESIHASKRFYEMKSFFGFSRHSRCDAGCSETLTTRDGGQYVGETANGVPSGRGVLTERDGTRVAGEWAWGSPIGLITRTTPRGDVYKGFVVDWRFVSGGTLGHVNVEFKNGDRYGGSLDDQGQFKEGVYRRGPAGGPQSWEFDGHFRAGQPLAGTWLDRQWRFEGLMDRDSQPWAGLLRVRADAQAPAGAPAQTLGYFDAERRPHGYAAQTWADGRVDEQLFEAGRPTGPLLRTLPSGEMFVGRTDVPGKALLGARVPAPPAGAASAPAADAAAAGAEPGSLAADGTWQRLPMVSPEAARALELAQASARELTEARTVLRKLLGL